MVIAQARSESFHHSEVSDRLEHCISSYAQAVVTGRADNSTVITHHATTAQEIMAINIKTGQNVSTQRNNSTSFQRMGMVKRSKTIKVPPVVCRTRASRTHSEQWHCHFGILFRTAELVRHNQQLQRRISELQRETDLCFQSTQIQLQPTLYKNRFGDVSASGSECESSTSRSPSPAVVLPPDSVEPTHCNFS